MVSSTSILLRRLTPSSPMQTGQNGNSYLVTNSTSTVAPFGQAMIHIGKQQISIIGRYVHQPIKVPYRSIHPSDQTNDLEWYYPGAITTKDGALEITMSERIMNNLNYTSGLLSTWNKFCFTGGMVVASVSLPGANNVPGMCLVYSRAANVLTLYCFSGLWPAGMHPLATIASSCITQIFSHSMDDGQLRFASMAIV